MTYPGLTARSHLTALRIHFWVRVGDLGLGVSDSILGLLSCLYRTRMVPGEGSSHLTHPSVGGASLRLPHPRGPGRFSLWPWSEEEKEAGLRERILRGVFIVCKAQGTGNLLDLQLSPHSPKQDLVEEAAHLKHGPGKMSCKQERSAAHSVLGAQHVPGASGRVGSGSRLAL